MCGKATQEPFSEDFKRDLRGVLWDFLGEKEGEKKFCGKN